MLKNEAGRSYYFNALTGENGVYSAVITDALVLKLQAINSAD